MSPANDAGLDPRWTGVGLRLSWLRLRAFKTYSEKELGMTSGHDDAGREELNRRRQELNERLLAAPPDERNQILVLLRKRWCVNP